MRWIAPSEKDTANEVLEKRLWAAADQFRANSGLKAGQYSAPVLGLIYLRFAEARFALRRAQLESPSPSGTREHLKRSRGARGEGKTSRRGTSRIDEPAAYHAEGVLYLTLSARFVAEHKRSPSSKLSIFGVEKTDETGRLCRMNLAVHGLEGVGGV